MAIGVSTKSPELSMRESGNNTGGGREWKSFTAWLSFDIYEEYFMSAYDSKYQKNIDRFVEDLALLCRACSNLQHTQSRACLTHQGIDVPVYLVP